MLRGWNEISKPDSLKEKNLEDLFQLEFVMLRHKKYEPELFLQNVAELKGRFALDASNTLFLPNAE